MVNFVVVIQPIKFININSLELSQISPTSYTTNAPITFNKYLKNIRIILQIY